ncbi:MAG TPA: glycosyltransferase family 4 protein [Segeticoccus sp.]|uniref:glycosyltransferase family 4 protein n=1 Tax=Segeticoccus sp. TaxID=2706531 RepID=UPI002D7FCF58|nr:glycosyltransferase family 4 protein [Segeticoccus sp.]HET8599499.1 glycosyltransferase family 4 protein [Segeticoccus sp.]
MTTQAGSSCTARPARPAPPVLRVCHVIHSLQPGGAEHLLVDLALAGRAHGIHSTVLALVGGCDTEPGRALRTAGVAVRSLALANRWDPRALGLARDEVAASRCDLVHTHLKHADLAGAHAARALGLPMVSTLHVIEDAPDRVGRAKRWLAAQARIRTAGRTIAVSEAQRQWYLSVFPGEAARVTTVRNGVAAAPALDARRRAALRTELGARPGDVLATLVAVVRPEKGHADLVAALDRLPEDLPLAVALVGDGPAMESVRRVVAASPHRDRIRLTGYRTDAAALLAASDLALQPSHEDALPTTLIHALAAGVPAVATTVGGIPEIVAPGTGLLVPPRRPDLLADAVAELVTDPLRRARLGAAARRRYEAEFSAGVWTGRLREVYDEVRARHTASRARSRQPG